MKKLSLLVLSVAFLFVLSSCNTEERTLSCENDMMSFEIVYNEDEMISFTQINDGVSSTQDDEHLAQTTRAFEKAHPGDDFFEVMELYKTTLETDSPDTTCTVE